MDLGMQQREKKRVEDDTDFLGCETEVVLKLEPGCSMDEDSPDQPSAVYITAQPMFDNTLLLCLDSKHTCYLCSAAFVLVSSLELHLASVHGEKVHVVLPGSSTPDRCDAGNCITTDIDKGIISHSNRKTTTRKDVGVETGDDDAKKKKRYPCDTCEKSFCRPTELKRHKLIHSGVKPFVCDLCSKSFTTASNMSKHKLIHSGKKPCVCSVCNKAFTFATDLRKHMRIHTGERPFKCPHCDGNFRRSEALHRHVQSVHDDARPHVCDVCGAAFSHASHLKRHYRSHTGEKPYVCSSCGKALTSSTSLKEHYLVHSGEKPHSCPHCPFTSRQAQYMKRHIRRIHPLQHAKK